MESQADSRDCVVVYHRGITRIGTDDAENLAALLRTKVSNKTGQQ